MMVVSDNSPINILIRIEQIHLLPVLFGHVLIPQRVADEMKHPSAPHAIRNFIENPPDWLTVREPTALLKLNRLDPGELAAISLAVELHADVLLVDERDARGAALAQGLNIVGAIGILERAADQGLILDLQAVHDQIRRTDFRVGDSVLNESLARHQRAKTR